jgi:Glutaredoxin-like domain (DUF836).
MIDVRIYSRLDCHLCDVAKETIDRLKRDHDLPIEVAVIDVDRDPQLHRLYTDQVPVIFVEGKKTFKVRVDERKFLARVERAAESRRKGESS